ncbi:MAG: PASTA domain-containing protein [Marmoricola sp.]
MSDENLTELLERAADVVPVGPVPLAAAHALAARRARRRRLVTVMASAAAVAAAIAGTVAVVPHRSHRPDIAPVPAPKTRLFGLGHVAVDVPASWAAGSMACAPVRDAVVIGPMIGNCILQPRPKNVELIELERSYGDAPKGSSRLVIDGHDAYASRTACGRSRTDDPVACAATVTVPSENVRISLISTTSRATVADMQKWIRVLPNRTAVPPPNTFFDPSTAGASYQRLLEASGFRVVPSVHYSERGFVGEIARVSPMPGTMLAPGSTIRYTVSNHRTRLTLSVANLGTPPFSLKDSTIRVAAYAQTALGTRLTLFIKGAEPFRERIQVDANSRYLRPTPIVGALPRGVSAFSWTVVATGRTTMKIYVTDHGHRTIIGNVVLRKIRDHI